MTSLRVTMVWVLSVLAGGASVAACGEDGQSLGKGQCPQLPLFRWEWERVGPDGGTVQWKQVRPDGTDLSQADKNVLNEASKGQPHCISPLGSATNVFDPVGAPSTGGRSGTGGSGPADSGAD